MFVVRNDTDFWRSFREGEEAVIRELYLLHYRPLCYFAERLINNKTEAEDIAVDAFVKLLDRKSDFNSLPQVKSFLYTVVRNACFDFLRRNKVKDKNEKEMAYLSAPDELFGQEEMITAKVLQVIYAEVENLPTQCKQVFKSIFIEGKSTAEVAAAMHISTQTVLNQKSKAIHTLRLILYKEGLYYAIIFAYCLGALKKS